MGLLSWPRHDCAGNRLTLRGFSWLPLLLSFCAPKARDLPPLPTLSPESFPLYGRKAVGDAYRAAMAKPEDGPANVRLGNLLHIADWRDAARVCYRRAFDSFEARYYLAALEATSSTPDVAVKAYEQAFRIGLVHGRIYRLIVERDSSSPGTVMREHLTDHREMLVRRVARPPAG